MARFHRGEGSAGRAPALSSAVASKRRSARTDVPSSRDRRIHCRPPDSRARSAARSSSCAVTATRPGVRAPRRNDSRERSGWGLRPRRRGRRDLPPAPARSRAPIAQEPIAEPPAPIARGAPAGHASRLSPDAAAAARGDQQRQRAQDRGRRPATPRRASDRAPDQPGRRRPACKGRRIPASASASPWRCPTPRWECHRR